MNLNVKERLLLLGMLPLEGSLSDMVDIYDIAKQLKLTDEEKKDINYNDSSNYLSWNAEKDPNKDINISEDLLKIIRKTIDTLDAQGKISLELIPLILKIKNGTV